MFFITKYIRNPARKIYIKAITFIYREFSH